jgi:hypothetical protein
VERENAFFKSSPVDEYHLPQMNSEKVFFCVIFKSCTLDTKSIITFIGNNRCGSHTHKSGFSGQINTILLVTSIFARSLPEIGEFGIKLFSFFLDERENLLQRVYIL